MLRYLALGVLAIVAGLAVFVALQPGAFRVERSTTVQAPSHRIYPHVADLRAMEAWSPFAQMDPEQENVYTGPASGVGATCSWHGGKAGRGRMTITAVEPDRLVDLRLEFFEPVRATNRASFTLTPVGDATRVTWSMEGTNGFVGKAFALVMDMDRMVGGQFEKGLASMKSLAEAAGDGG